MFAGIVQNRAVVQSMKKSGGQIHFVFHPLKKERAIKLGASIAINGVCLTASRVSGKTFEADVISATLRSTALGTLRVGDEVNVERSLTWGDSIDGHFVTGHSDGVGFIRAIEKRGKNRIFTIEAPAKIAQFLAVKGSVAVDGVSLTIQSMKKNSFDIALVPHTLKVTNLGAKQKSDAVNLEIDLLARYGNEKKTGVSGRKLSSKLTFKVLEQQGF